MPLDAPVTIATLLDSLLVFTIALDPIARNAGENEEFSLQRNSVKTLVMARATPGPWQWQAYKTVSTAAEFAPSVPRVPRLAVN
jgi:hypothetical protein